jgi:hypothetical protein
MTWTKYISKKYNVPYWHNSITKESVWLQPADFFEHKEEKPLQNRESNSNSMQITNNNGQVWSMHVSSEHNLPFWYNSKTKKSVWEKPADFIEQKEEKKVTVTKPTNVVKTEEQKMRQLRESNSVQISNNNGQSWTIEGQSHWTNEDYRESLRDLNQSLRDY